jgi:hypothetical protein
MIFDDHDITDDWNLSAQWEETAYGHPFSKRIIGNALLALHAVPGLGQQAGCVWRTGTRRAVTGAQANALDSPCRTR